jgi:hypothetical protein
MNDLLKARSLWARKSKAETIKTIVDRVERKVQSGKRVNRAAAYQGEFEKLAGNPKAMRQFNADERAAIEGIVKGAGPVTKFLSRLAPAGYLSTVLSPGLGASIGNLLLPGGLGAAVGGVGVPAVGGLARGAAVKNVLGKVDALDEAVRSGAKIAKPPGSPLPRLVPFYGAREIARDKNGIPLLDSNGQYVPAR